MLVYSYWTKEQAVFSGSEGGDSKDNERFERFKSQ